MEELPKNLISFFVSFIKSHTDTLADKEKLIRKMMTMRNVQSIIIETMFRLEPIINEQVIGIKSQTPSKNANNKSRESHLLTLSRDIKQQMENFANIQESLSNVLNLVESINLNVEELPAQPTKTFEAPELVNFLSTMAGKPKISNFEIESISDDTWAKHMEVEKMLKVEVQKFENKTQKLENSFFSRISSVKLRAANKIIRLETELQNTWEYFRILHDRSTMQYEDKVSKEIEQFEKEEEILGTGNEMQAKDYSQAIAKIKNLIAARKILEKRKHQDEKLIAGLNSKISLLNEKIVELKIFNGSLIENCGSLSWCLEFLIGKMDIPAVVKEKVLKLISKQKCKKLENLFKVDEVFEKYSVESLSKKFENLKNGIAEVCIHVADENLKIKLRKLVTDSKLDEINKKSAVKHLQLPKAPLSLPKRGKSSTGSIQSVKKDLVITPKEVKSSSQLAKPETSLDKMKKAMLAIDKELADHEKVVQEVYAETIKVRDTALQDLSANDSIMKSIENDLTSPNSMENPFFFPESLRYRNLEIVSTRSEEHLRDSKSTQTISNELLTQASTPVHRVSAKHLTIENLQQLYISPLQKHFKFEKYCQTDEQNEASATMRESDSLIQGLMLKSNILKFKNPIEPNLSDSLLVTNLGKAHKVRSLRAGVIGNIEESLDDIFKQKKRIELSLNNTTLPLEGSRQMNRSPSRVTPSKLGATLTAKKQNHFSIASEEYKKEFILQLQYKGIKKTDSQSAEMVWEEVIKRRLLEGEKDKISLHLRGYLGTDKFESEKSKMITMIEGNDKNVELSKINVKIEKYRRSFENWKKLMTKFLEKLSFNFKSQLSEDDSSSDILFKVAKNLKFIKHRLMRKVNKNIPNNARREEIIFAPDKWAVNSTSLSPLESLRFTKKIKVLKKPKFLSRFISKTPLKEKLLGIDSSRLPYL